LIIPEIAAGAAAELDDLRAACDAAIDGLAAGGADAVVVLGAGDRTGWLPAGATGTFAPFGVSIEVSLAPGSSSASAGCRLPLGVAVGAWLLARRPWSGPPARAATVAADADPAECAALAGELRGRTDRVALLVMGDGSARRGEKAPGYDDPRARPYDDAVARALATADVAALRGLDPGLAAELLASGRAPLQVLAGAADGTAWRGDLSYYAAPYGVAYFVAGWRPS
jgi:hypothetical protein